MVNVVLVIAGLALAVPGGEALYRQLASRSPFVTTCAEYARTRPAASWLRVRDCEVDYLGAGYRESGDTIQELFFPVRPAGAPRSEPAWIVAATRDPSVLAIAQSGIGPGKQPDQEQFLVMMLRIVTALGAAREIEGLARDGIVDRLRTRRVLSGLTTPVAPGAVVVDLHRRPRVLVPAVQTGVGLALTGLVLVLSRRSRRLAPIRVPAGRTEVAADGADAAADAVAQSATTPAVRLRGLLLLKLGPDAGIGHIEHAAPLGPREETIRHIRGAIPGMEFDARGRGTIRGSGWVVIVDVGTNDPVATAVAGADGAAGADALRRLLVETGWRAYVPRTGAFTDATDLEALAASGGGGA